MPWSGGSYTLPPGTLVTSGTPIEAPWANTLTQDLEAAITATLPRDGSAPMLAPFPNLDGNQVNPGITFNNELTSGWWRDDGEPGVIYFGLLGNRQFRYQSQGGNNAPVFEAYSETADEWREMPHQWRNTNVVGNWTFGSTVQIDGNVTLPNDNSLVVGTSAADEANIYIDPTNIRMRADDAAANNGVAWFRYDKWNGSAMTRRIQMGIDADVDFRVLAYEDDGTTLTAAIFDWQRTTNRLVFVGTEVRIGNISSPGDQTLDVYNVSNFRENTFFQGDDTVSTVVYNKLLVDGETGTSGYSPSSATFAKGLDCEDDLRLWNMDTQNVNLEFGFAAPIATGGYAVGDFVRNYQFQANYGSSDFRMRRWDATAEDWQTPEIFRFARESTFTESTFNFYHRVRSHNVTGYAGTTLQSQDKDSNWNPVGWLRPREEVVSASETIDLADEHRVIIVDTDGITLTMPTFPDGSWVQIQNTSTGVITLDAGSADFQWLSGSGTPTSHQTLELRGGSVATIYRQTAATDLYSIFGTGIQTP